MTLTTSYLDYLIAGKEPVQMFVKIGSSIKLSGTLVGYDEDSYFLTRNGVTQMVSRYDVATVLPENAFLMEDLQ